MGTSSTTDLSNNLFENARFLHAFIECNDSIQEGVKTMLKIVFDKNTDEDEKRMALHTIADALYPNPHNGQLGMDLEESEAEAAQAFSEISDIVREMNDEEDLFASRLRCLMEERGMTQSHLASLVGIGQPAISNMLIRQCRPQRRTILRLSEALSVKPQDLWPGFSE